MKTSVGNADRRRAAEVPTMLRQALLPNLIVFAAYAVLAQIGYRFSAEANVTPIWLPSGAALAAVFYFNGRVAPGIFFGSFVGNFATFSGSGAVEVALLVSAAIGFGAVLQALAALWVLKRFANAPHAPLETTNDVLVLAFFSGAAASILNATIGATSVTLGGYAVSPWSQTWLTWWLGDTVGVLLMTPFILTWRKRPKINRDSRQDLVVILLAIIMILFLFAIRFPLYLFLLPAVVVITWRYGMYGATLLSLAMSFMIRGAINATIVAAPEQQLTLIVPAFLGSVALTALVLAAAIHERRVAQKKLEEYNRTLTEKISARTHEINTANAELFRQVVERQRMLDELRRAKETAEAASDAKTTFMASMSHELRTPLNAIIGYTEIMLAGMAGEMNEEQVFYQERVLLNSNDLLALINQVLDFSKLDAGRVELMPAPVALRDLVDEIARQYMILAQKRGLALKVLIGEAMPPVVQADRERLKQIIVNLISNAIKFTPAGEVMLRVYRSTPKTWIIEVSDTGVGIAPHDLSRIFEDFTQVNIPKRGKADGTGLGLAIVRRLVTAMRGEVNVTSQLGKGSTFTVTLPLTLPLDQQETQELPGLTGGLSF